MAEAVELTVVGPLIDDRREEVGPHLVGHELVYRNQVVRPREVVDEGSIEIEHAGQVTGKRGGIHLIRVGPSGDIGLVDLDIGPGRVERGDGGVGGLHLLRRSGMPPHGHRDCLAGGLSSGIVCVGGGLRIGLSGRLRIGLSSRLGGGVACRRRTGLVGVVVPAARARRECEDCQQSQQLQQQVLSHRVGFLPSRRDQPRLVTDDPLPNM